MKKRKFLKFFSSILAFVMVLSLLSPFPASANTEQTKPFKPNGISESTMQLKSAIAEQLSLLDGAPKLHKDLQNLSGNEQVAVIVHLSENPVGLEKGISQLKGKQMTSSQEKKIKEKVNQQQAFVNKAMVSNGISFEKGYSFDTVLNGFAAKVKAEDLEKLLDIKGITLVEPDATVYAFADDQASKSSELVKDDQMEAAMNTSISFLGIEKLWKEGYEGQGIKVAVLDTGIDTKHPEFAGIYKGGKNFVPHTGNDYTRPRADDDPSETSPKDWPAHRPEFNERGSAFYTSHGTHVAGTIAAIGANQYGIKGIAPKVDLYAYRVLGAYGSGSNSGIIKAIDTAAIEKMDVINLSLGGDSSSETASGSIAINNAMMAGTISVIATGNAGPNRGTIGDPSTARLGIAVGNTTNPETQHNGKVDITVGEYKFSKQLNLMGTTFGQEPDKQLNGQFELVEIPGVGKATDYNGIDVKGKVALIARGEVAFVDKIAAAKDNGAIATIIHNFSGGTNAPDESGTFLGDSYAFIPTFDMSVTDGNAIRAELKKGKGTITFGNFGSMKTLGDDVNDSSSRGPTTPNFDIKPDVAAPGTNIMSTVPAYGADFPDAEYDESYDRKTGTSMATPHIAGIAALIKQANPNWTVFDVKVALSNTAKILDTNKYDVFSQGAGRVDAYAAAHSGVLAYAMDTANNDGEEVENLKGTVTFGPQKLDKNISVTKQILVKDLKAEGGDFNVTSEVTKEFGDAKLTIDKPSFTLNGEQMLEVTLTASKNAGTKAGDEFLGYIHINSANNKISLPFAADFGGKAAVELKNYKITETDLSFNGDGVKDEALLSFTITGDLGINFIELWDIMNPEGGEFGDGYIGYLHAANALTAGSYNLAIKGKYKPWTAGTQLETIPDGLYTIDLNAQTVSGNPPTIGDYVGPIVVKTTNPEIAVKVADGNATGQVTDKYIEYNEELIKYGLSYDLNEKLHASFVITRDGVKEQSVPIQLKQDGSFEFEPGTLNENDTVTVIVEDAAGNKGEKVISGENQPEPNVTLSVDQENLSIEIGKTATVKVTETTNSENGPVDVDVTSKATYEVENTDVLSVDKGVITAKAAGTSKVTIRYGDNAVIVNVKVTPGVTLSVDQENLSIEIGKTATVKVTETTNSENGPAEEDVTSKATYEVENADVLSVDKGVITAKAAGTSKITIGYGDNTVIVNVTVVISSAADLKALVERFDKEGAFSNSLSVRQLTSHLTALELYEKQGDTEKALKHLNSFIVLLDFQKTNGLISDQAYNSIKANAEYLIAKWS